MKNFTKIRAGIFIPKTMHESLIKTKSEKGISISNQLILAYNKWQNEAEA